MSHLHLHATIDIGDHLYPVFGADIPEAWREIALEKGYEVTARVRDRYHLVLRHDACGKEMIAKVFTLRTAEPVCPTCLDARRRELCAAAGVTYLGRGNHPNYLRVALPCGHETLRQQELLERVCGGKTAIRCGECLTQRLEEEARARGWELMGADPTGDLNYRNYRHDCGQVQRVAVVNMQTGRFACGGCSNGWTRDPSYIYLMRFVLRNGHDALKVGFSRDPHSRLRHQLITERDQYARLIRTIEIPTGRQAIRLEKDLHLGLRREFPEAVLDRAQFATEVKVVSELYDASIEAEIMQRFDELACRMKALVRHKARLERVATRRAKRRDKRHGRKGRC